MALQPKTDQPSPAICGEVSIKIDANFDDCELSLQLKDGKYHCMIDGQLYPLATTLFERFPDKVRKLLKIGGSVMAMCYALYNLGLHAYNFMRGTLRFTIGFDDVDKMASVKLNMESGKFHEALWKEWKRIVDKHKKELGHLQKAFVADIPTASSEIVDVGQSSGEASQECADSAIPFDPDAEIYEDVQHINRPFDRTYPPTSNAGGIGWFVNVTNVASPFQFFNNVTTQERNNDRR